MEIMAAMIILLFLALVGITNIFIGLGRWLSKSGTLAGCTLVVTLPDNADIAEALLLHTVELLNLDSELCTLPIGVICPRESAARKIGELFCRDRDMPIACTLQELSNMIYR